MSLLNLLLVGLSLFAHVSTPCKNSDIAFPRGRIPGYTCGVLCAERALSILGAQPPKLEELISTKYISAPEGSTVDDLQRLVSDFGGSTQVFTNVSGSFLAAINKPVLLHFKSDLDEDAFAHWVLFVGMSKEGYRILDPPGEPFNLTAAELQSLWDGVAIVVAAEERSHLGSVAIWVFAQLFPLTALVVASIAISAFCLHRKAADKQSGIGMILFSAALIATGRNIVFDDGFLRDLPVTLKLAKPSSVVQPTIVNSADELARLIADKPYYYIDSRMPADFSYGHVKNALNIPPIASTTERGQIVSDIDKLNSVLIVYCQSEYCDYSDVVAKRLLSDGFEHAVVFRPGWRGLERKP